MTRTSEILHISQPALSKAIRTLEDELQVKLFDRAENRMKLNKNGVQFYEYAQKSLAYLDAGIMTARSSKYDIPGTITIQNWVYAPIMGQCIGEYLKINPLVNFNFCRNPIQFGADPCFMVCALTPEAAITKRVVRDNTSWIVQELLSAGYVLIMKRGYMDIPEDVSEIEMSLFKDARFIVNFDEDIVYKEITYSYCSDAGFYPHIFCRIEEFISKMTMVAAGEGVSIIPEFCLPQAYQLCPDLRVFTVKDDTRICTIGILRKNDSGLNEAEKDFWDYVMDYFNIPS